MTIEEARAIVANVADKEGRSGFAAVVRSGAADDNVAVQSVLRGATLSATPVPEMVPPMPDSVDMGEVKNLSDE